MLPSSHFAPINADAFNAQGGAGFLADAFSEFISAANRLEDSYRELQKEVVQLRTELEERNAALQSSLAENERMRMALQRIMDSLPCGVIVVQPDRSIAMINPEAIEMLELASSRTRNVGDISLSLGIDLQTLCGGRDEAEQEFCISRNGRKRWIAVRNRRLSSERRAARSSQTVLIFRDITAQKRAEQEREEVRNAVALAEISTVLAHEIRNPLASLELFAGLINGQGGDSDEWVSHLRAGIRSLSATVNNVLRFHSVGSPQLSPCNLGKCLQNGLEFIRPIADQSGVLIAFENDAADVQIAADENALQQVILNLGCNAIRHTPAGGRLMVRLNATGGKAIAEFRDSGCGIASEQLEKVFDAGYSGTGQTPGLGLAVCKRIVTQHGGTIGVSSRVNEGTTFHLEFPAL